MIKNIKPYKYGYRIYLFEKYLIKTFFILQPSNIKYFLKNLLKKNAFKFLKQKLKLKLGQEILLE
jgi:hypothetical protein